MTKLIINLFLIFIISSCKIHTNNNVSEIIEEKKDSLKKIVIEKENKIKIKNEIKNENLNNKSIKYILGDKYYIEGVEYIPEENYKYNEVGLASFYGKNLHNKKTINNDLNKVTELLGRHKTLPLPSIVKVTNLDNGLSIILKINDRHNDNSSLIQVSRKSAQLLKFYKNKIAKVRVTILSDPSKQMKVVTESMSDSNFNNTIDSAPTEKVSISNLDNEIFNNQTIEKIDQPIEIGFEEIGEKGLFLKIFGFKNYINIKKTIFELNIFNEFTYKKEGDMYSIIIGPLKNLEANNLVLSFISKGYSKTEFIIK